MGRILAVDYGLKRTGLAVTDPLRIIATSRARRQPVFRPGAPLTDGMAIGHLLVAIRRYGRSGGGRPDPSAPSA